MKKRKKKKKGGTVFSSLSTSPTWTNLKRMGGKQKKRKFCFEKAPHLFTIKTKMCISKMRGSFPPTLLWNVEKLLSFDDLHRTLYHIPRQFLDKTADRLFIYFAPSSSNLTTSLPPKKKISNNRMLIDQRLLMIPSRYR